jgi:hypothetical protein
MELSSSWEAASRSATPGFPNILRNPMVHCRGPYPEPVESSPFYRILSLVDQF